MQEIHTANSTVDRYMGTAIISEEIFIDNRMDRLTANLEEKNQSSKSRNDFSKLARDKHNTRRRRQSKRPSVFIIKSCYILPGR